MTADTRQMEGSTYEPDTPLLQAKRVAFDNPTQANLDALIAVAKSDGAALVRAGGVPQPETAYRPSDWLEGLIAITSTVLANPDADVQDTLKAFAESVISGHVESERK